MQPQIGLTLYQVFGSGEMGQLGLESLVVRTTPAPYHEYMLPRHPSHPAVAHQGQLRALPAMDQICPMHR